MTLAYLSTAWLIGIAAARYLSPLLAPSTALRAGLIGLLATLHWPLSSCGEMTPEHGASLPVASSLLLGSARYTLSLPDLADPGHIAKAQELRPHTDQGEVTMRSRVVGEPGVRDTYTNLRLTVDRVQIEEGEHLVKGTILVRTPRYPTCTYGDELEVEGELETPPPFEGFSYRDYLARQGIYGMVGWPRIRLFSRDGGSRVYRALLAFKARTQATIARILPEPEASLLTGILLGVETGIPEAVKDAVATTGTTHMIAISGFN